MPKPPEPARSQTYGKGLDVDALAQRCQAQFNPQAVAFNGTISLCWPSVGLESSAGTPVTERRLALGISPGQLRVLAPGAPTQASFYFHNLQALEDLLFEHPAPYNALLALFMDGKVRSSGYLLWTFPLLGLFRAGG